MPPEIPLQVVRRGIVMDQTQTLPPPQAVLKMAGEFILDPLMGMKIMIRSRANDSCVVSARTLRIWSMDEKL